MSERVPLSEVVDKDTGTVSETTEPNRITNIGSQSFIGDINYHRAADFLELDGADRNSKEMMEKVGKIFGWGMNWSGSNDHVEVLGVVKSLKSRLGLQSVGKDLVNKLYRWISLDTSQLRLQKQKDLLSEKNDIIVPG